MTFANPRSFHRTRVLGAAALILFLAGALGVRLMARETDVVAVPQPPASLLALELHPIAPPATVPPPAIADWRTVETPCWSCPEARNDWPIRFRTDLDLLAPLGDGAGNAAEFFGLFAKEVGPRRDEADIEKIPSTVHPDHEWVGGAFAFDHPLVLEAEPWVDQATMRFYEDVFPLEGWKTHITNLLFMLRLSRTWIQRGMLAEDPAVGLDDCRRALRLGRLLRQEDVVVINDLVGLASIHLGARGMLEIARRTGDHELAFVAATVVGEAAPQRFLTSQRITELDVIPHVKKRSWWGGTADLPEVLVHRVISAMEAPDRRLRGEAILTAQFAMEFADAETVERFRNALERLASGDDELTAIMARYSLDEELTEEAIAEAWGLE
jgi:hypothetical protein